MARVSCSLAAAVLLSVATAQSQTRPTWSKVIPSSSTPLTGRGAQIGLATSATAVFAGGNQGQGDSTLPPMMTYDLNTGAVADVADTTAWTKANMAATASQQYVTGLSATTETLWTFGGVDLATGREHNALATFDATARTWTNIAPAAGAVVGTTLPPASRQASFVYLPRCRGDTGVQSADECFLLYGGAVGQGAATTRYSDLWMYIPSTNAWSKPAAAQSSSSGGKPPALSNAAAVASPNGDAMYIFGGETSGGVVNDVYVLDPRGTFWSDPQSSEMKNLALNMRAVQSSTYKISATNTAQWCNASLATDGVISMYLQDASSNCKVAGTTATTTGNGLTTTGGEVSPYFMVDLGSAQTFDALALYTRSTSDMGPGRFAGMQIYFGNDPTAPNPTLGIVPGNGANTACPNVPVDVFMTSTTIKCAGTGRYVFIWLPPMATAGRYLFISEFQVLQRTPWVWRRLSGVANVALGRPVFSSGTNTLSDPINSGPIENMVDGIITNNWPYLAHTNPNPPGCDNIYVAIDLGANFDLSQVALWPRLGCCIYRSQRLELYAGSSRDWRANKRVLFPVGTQFDMSASQSGYATWYSGNCPATLGAGATGTSCWLSDPNKLTGVRARYIQLRKVPYNANLCSSSALAGQDDNAMNVAEFQVWAQKLVDSPAPRAGMGFTYFRGSLVIAAGFDGAGFRLNDVRFFDLFNNRWLPPVTPLGSPPSVRTNPMLLVLPDPTNYAPFNNVPAKRLALVGGFDASGTAIGDMNILDFPACTPRPGDNTQAFTNGQTGIQTEICGGSGTACKYGCYSQYTLANPTNWLTCQPDGRWSGLVPVCVPNVAPPAVSAVTAGQAYDPNNASIPLPNTVVVRWTQPSAGAQNPWPIASYRVSAKPADYVEALTSAVVGPGKAWTMAPIDVPVTTSFFGWDSTTGALFLDNMEGAGTSPYNNLNLIRDFPTAESGIAVDTDWAVESYLWVDSTTVRTIQDKSMLGLCIYDMGIYHTWAGGSGQRTGACQFYAGIRRNNGQFEYGWENLFASTGGTYSASGWNFWYKAPQPGCWVRIERNSTAGTWRTAFKFQAAGPWTYLPVVPATDTRLVNGTITKPWSSNLKLGIITRTWSGTARMLGFTKYIRVTPLGDCQDPGSTRILPATAVNATMTGLTAGRTYQFRVEALNVAGKASTAVPASGSYPVAPAAAFNWSSTLVDMYNAGLLVDAITKTSFTKTTYLVSVWNADVNNYGPQFGIDGLPDNAGGSRFVQAGRLGGYWLPAGANRDLSLASSYTGTSYTGGTANAIDPLGDWWAVDLGIRTSVKALFIAGRNNGCCVGRTSTLEVYIGDAAPPYWNLTTQCDPSLMPVADMSVSTARFDPGTNKTFPYSGVFPCSQTGRYVYLRAPPSLGVGNQQDGQMNFAEVRIYSSNQCPPRVPSNTNNIDVMTPGLCANGKYGDVCVQQCKPGFTPVSGSSVATCDGDNWDGVPLMCAPVCPPLPAPGLMGTCTQTFFSDSFASSASLSNWFAANSRQPIGAKWFAVDGTFEASTRLGCFDQMFALVGSTKIANYLGDFSVMARIRNDGQTQTGLVFLSDKAGNNYFRVYLDSELNKIVLDRSINGVLFTIIDAPLTVVPNVWYFVDMDYSSSTKSVNVTVDGAQVLTSALYAPNSMSTGYAGVYAATSAWIDDFTFSTPCNGCSGALAGETCTFACQPGLVTSGPATRTCTDAGAGIANWITDPVAQPFTCRVPQPTFAVSTLSVSEAAARNAPVGQPLLGSTSSPDFQLQWSILSETPFDNNLGSIFWVDVCSGQVKLRQAGVMDYYAWTTSYTLLVRAGIAGYADSYTDRNITVNVIRVDTPPRLTPTLLTLRENSAGNVAVGVPLAWDRENSTYTWALTADGSGGDFSMDSATGIIKTTAAAGCVASNTTSYCRSSDLDFERAGGSSFALTVTATQSSTCCNTPGPLSSTTTVTVQLQDVNDAPSLPAEQELVVLDSAALPGAQVATVQATDADGSSSAFYSPLTYSLVTPAVQALYPICMAEAFYPTKSGAASDPLSIFQINAATGMLTLHSTASNLPLFNSYSPFAAYGTLVRRVYTACVNVSDNFGGWSIGAVRVLMEADTQNTPVIRSWNSPVIGMDCRGAETIVFQGNGFSPSVVSWTAVYINSEGSTFRPACRRLSNFNMSCTTVAGAGKDIKWTVYADGVEVATTTTLINAYRKPLMNSWDFYAQHMGTNGFYNGQSTSLPIWMYLTSGTFPTNPAAVNASISIVYGKDLEYTCTYLSTASSYIACMGVPGTGTLLPWRMTIAGQSTDWTEYNANLTSCTKSIYYLGGTNPGYTICPYTFSYEPPTIVSITPLPCSPQPCTLNYNATRLDTSGGQKFIVNGTNFGASNENRFVVSFGGPNGDKVNIGCQRAGGAQSHFGMVCTMPPGVGTGHAIQVSVNGFTLYGGAYKPGTSGFGYLPPVVTRVYGPGSSGANTPGGQTIMVEGNQFGPVSGTLSLGLSEGATYGPPGNTGFFAARSCRVTSSPDSGSGGGWTMACETTEGTGRGHSLQVTVGGQISNALPNAISYGSPSISTFAGVGSYDADTRGGQTVVITGNNFGPGTSNPSYATYFAPQLNVRYTVRLEDGPVSNVTFFPAACSVTNPHTELTCLTDAGAGKNLQWFITLAGLRSTVPTTAYAAPIVTGITDVNGNAVTNADVNGGTAIKIIGDRFGPFIASIGGLALAQTVTYGPTGGELTLPRGNWNVTSQTEIYAILPPGTGQNLKVQVAVADQTSMPSTATFSYAPPRIIAITPNTGHTASNPKAPTMITLTTLNLPLFDTRSIVGVWWGNDPNVINLPVELPVGAAAIRAATNQDGSVNIRIPMPEQGSGKDIAIRLTVSLLGSSRPSYVSPVYYADNGYTSTFSYLDPVITDVVVSRARFTFPDSMATQAQSCGCNASVSEGAVMCPFPHDASGNQQGIWKCTDLTLKKIEILGSDFGLFPGVLPPGAGTSELVQVNINPDRVDGAIKLVEILNQNDTFTGEVWGTQKVYLYNWNHNRIVLYSPEVSGALRVTIKSLPWNYIDGDATYGNMALQVATAPFTNRNPEIGFLTGGTVGIPTTGGDSSGTPGAPGVVDISINNLVNVARLLINVGNWTVPATSIINTDNNQFFASDAAVAAWLLTKTGFVNIRFVAPAGQGLQVPVQIVNQQNSGVRLVSGTGFTVSYSVPVMRKVQVISAAGAVIATYDAAALPKPTVQIPTDGTAKVRIIGTNLGLAPSLALGDAYRVDFSLECTLAVANAVGAPVRGGANGHTCYEMPTVAGEGNGVIYNTAYTIYVDNQVDGGQDATSNDLGFSYQSPVVTSVVPVVAATGLPTKGGVLVQIKGNNFGATRLGRPITSITVNFAIPGVGSPQPCGGVVRVNHQTLNCTLPEGSGKDLRVLVSVAGLDNGLASSLAPVFSYSAPIITAVASVEPVFNSTSFDNTTEAAGTDRFPRMRGSTAGGTIITLTGSNFGRADSTVHCVYLSWAFRDSSRNPVCNGVEDYLGEGEISAVNVISWDHEQIVFQSQAGLGKKEVQLSIRGANIDNSVTANVPKFWYANPRIDTVAVINIAKEEVTPALVGTLGGDRLVLRGANFGPAPSNTSGGWASLSLSDPDQFAKVGGMPTAYRIVTFHRTCVSDALDIFGARPDGTHQVTLPDLDPAPQPKWIGSPSSGCTMGQIVSWDHDKIVFLAQPGIGVNRSVSVVIDDGATMMASPSGKFSYRPPSITQYTPNPVMLGDRAEPALLLIQGNDFGDDSVRIQQEWSTLESQVSANVGGLDCSGWTTRRTEDGVTSLACNVNPDVPAGYRNVTIRVAGQFGYQDIYPINKALTVGCQHGYFGHENETCVPCPAQSDEPSLRGAECRGFLYNLVVSDRSQKHTYPRPLKGWYNLNSSDAYTDKLGWTDGMMSACPENWQGGALYTKPDGSIGRYGADRDVCIVPCDPPEACLGDNLCAYGYASKAPMFRCAYCDKGFYKRAGQCIKCPDSPAALFIGFALLVIFVAGLGFWLNKKQVNIAVVSIGVDFFQVLAIFSQSRVKWPPVIKELLHVLSAFNLNIEIVAPECLIPDVSYKQKFWFIMILPLCVFLLLLAFFSASAGYKAIIQGRPKREWLAGQSTLMSSALVLLYLLYLYLTRTIFDVFNCSPTTPDDGYTYLQVVFERCGVKGGTQVTLLPYAIAGLVVYTIGYPVTIGYFLITKRELVMEDQLLRAKGVGNDKLTNPHAFELRQTLGRSYFAFRPDLFWWTLCIILRKFCIAVTSVVFGKNSAFQMAACLLIMFLAYAAQVHARPYMSPGDFDKVLDEHTTASFTSTLHARLRAAIAGIETRGRKRARRNLMNSEGQVDRKAVFGVLTNWLFNYNTVEAIMQFAAVIVCLMGIMYEANTVSGATALPGSQDSVTSVVLIVVIFTILYLAICLFTEIYVLAGDAATAKKARAAAKRGKGKDKDVEGGSSGRASRSTAGDEDFNVGKVESATNPMFLNKSGDSGSAIAGASSSDIDALFSSRSPPPPELWPAFMQAYAEKSKALNDAQSQLAEHRRAAEISNSLADDATDGKRASKGAKSAFGPVSPVDGASGSNPLRAKSGASMSATRRASQRKAVAAE